MKLVPLSPGQSKFVGWILAISLVQLLVGLFGFANAALVEGLTLGYSTTNFIRFLAIIGLCGIDLAVASVYWFGVVQIARKGDNVDQKWLNWIHLYRWYCIYGLIKISLVVYLLAEDIGGHLTQAGYLGGHSLVNTVIPAVYLLGTWWLSWCEPCRINQLGRWFLGPRAAHWLDHKSRHEQ